MIRALRLLFLLCVLASLSRFVRAQEPDTDNLPQSAPESRLGSVFAMTESPDHAGFLGKRILRGSFFTASVSTRYASDVGDVRGYSAMVNLPIASFGTDVPINVDVLGLFGQAGVHWDRNPYGPTWENSNFLMGTVIHTAVTERFRPYVELDLNIFQEDVKGLYGPYDASTTRFEGARLEIESGLEYDITDFCAYRLAVGTNAKEFSRWWTRSALIIWPHERVFIEGGIGFRSRSSEPRFSIGGGLAF